MIPFQDLSLTNKPIFRDLEEAAIRVIRSGRYINGEEARAFEKSLAQLCGARYCVAVSSGLDALRLIFKAYMEMGRLREGDEVIVPANTFIATFLAVTECGLKGVAAEVDETTFCLDFKRLPLSGKTRAIVAVHLYGNPCWDSETLERLHRKGILVIEDNAQALGAVAACTGFNGIRTTGSLGDAAAISFYPAKNVGALGDAGAVVTSDPELAELVRALANYGAKEKYQHEFCGANCRMDELQAAFLRIKLPHTHVTAHERSRRARLYDRLITHPEVIKPEIMENEAVQVWHQYVVRHPRRDLLREWLRSNGVATEIHYPVACHNQKCYAGNPLLAVPEGGLPTAEKLASEVLSLPIADVSDDEIAEISKIINNFEG